MRTLALFALTISLAAASLVGCGGSQPLISASGAMSESHMDGQARALHRIRAAHSSYQLLYSFTGKPDGVDPKANLINVRGTLYGTTYNGGMRSKGTVFSVSTTGTERVFYSLGGHRGGHPVASLIDMGGTLYGTTPYGGRYGRNGLQHQHVRHGAGAA